MSVDTVTRGIHLESWKFRTEIDLRDNVVQPPNEKTVAKNLILNDEPVGDYGEAMDPGFQKPDTLKLNVHVC